MTRHENWRIESQRRSETAAKLLFQFTAVVSVAELPPGAGMEGDGWERPAQTQYTGWGVDGDELWALYMDHRGEKPVILFFIPGASAFHKFGICHMCVEYVEEPGENPSHFVEMMQTCRIGEKPDNYHYDGCADLPVCEACGGMHLGREFNSVITDMVTKVVDPFMPGRKVGKA